MCCSAAVPWSGRAWLVDLGMLCPRLGRREELGEDANAEHRQADRSLARVNAPAHTAPPRRVPLRTKLAFGVGTVAFGIKDNGFGVFLLLFYNQVVGLPAEAVGATIGLALVLDALIDPVVGNLSDRTRSRIGRRHPWMYGAALPVALSWLMLWHPPTSGTGATLGYLLIVGFLVRASLSAYEVPSISLLPEMTSDYQERTVVLRYRFLFGWVGGLVMLAIAYGLMFTDTPEYPNGLLNPDGYTPYAVIGAIVMLASILLSAWGTHKKFARPPAHPIDTAENLGQIIATLKYRPFLILMVAALFGMAIQGITFALTNYLFDFVWEFTALQFVAYTGILFASAVASFLVVVPIGRRFRKQRAAAICVVVMMLFASAPYWLRYFDLAPPNGSDWLPPFIFAFVFVGNTAGISATLFTTSMMADVTDHAASKGGKQTEGLFFAGYFFLQKAISGIGIFLSGLILGLVGFPENAQPGAVDQDVLMRLTLFYAAALVIFGLAAAWSYLRFPLGPVAGVDPQGLDRVIDAAGEEG